MKRRLLIIIAIGILPAISTSFASCIVNEDWSEAPCLDSIGNGWYNQDEVDQWTNYYSYKGPIFMEAKYLELSEAIKEDRVEEWAEESIENRNVYEYYFFSGRAPNTGEYHGRFNIIPINEGSAFASEPDISPPLKQFRLGILFDEIQCRDSLTLITKYDGSPACVKPETKQKLIDRDWAREAVTDSLKISNAERDAKLAAGYKLYPGVGWVHPSDLGNLKPIYRDYNGEQILDLDAMLDEKIFVDKCESNGGVWNYTYHDCEGIREGNEN